MTEDGSKTFASLDAPMNTEQRFHTGIVDDDQANGDAERKQHVTELPLNCKSLRLIFVDENYLSSKKLPKRGEHD